MSFLSAIHILLWVLSEIIPIHPQPNVEATHSRLWMLFL
jgi:hypothetical protein